LLVGSRRDDPADLFRVSTLISLVDVVLLMLVSCVVFLFVDAYYMSFSILLRYIDVLQVLAIPTYE
jgi:hypothetical protein